MSHFKHFLLFTFILTSFGLFAQKKHQGLLWEISGNGLTENSYIYGTMHVSNKLAFNVSDSFYVCLNTVDGIALESSPADWMKEYRDMGAFGGGRYDLGSDFYTKAFQLNQPKNEVIYNLLENKNGLMNQILYRFNPGNEDYQENTFLDMFIFQAGAKTDRPIFSLEEMDEVMELSIKSLTPDKDKKRDNSNNNYLDKDGHQKFAMLEDAYRRGDLDQIDSLSKADNPTEVYHKYFIVERNRNMVKRMDSLMHKHSIFTGIGAAHLPGNEGAIELLRNLGYSVRAVSSKSSGKSHKMRKKLEKLYKPILFSPNSTSDHSIVVSTPEELYEMPTYARGRLEYLCPEPVNGGYYSIIRLFTYGPIFNKTPEHYKETFDSLLYIATPGEIMKKEDINLNGHIGYNIVTKTTNNSIVNYRVFFTPTEIIVFKGSGIENYILKAESQAFFTEIDIKGNTSEWVNVSPTYRGAQWSMKGTVTGQDMIEGMNDEAIDPFYQSYDLESKSYYQVMRYNLNDLDFIEEDSFDLAYLGEKYAKHLGYDIKTSKFKRSTDYSFVSQELTPDKSHQSNAKTLSLKIITQGSTYYLMATTALEEDKNRFFNSFEFSDFLLETEYEIQTDSLLLYAVNTYKKEDKPDYDALSYNLFNKYNEEDEDDSYLGENNSRIHYSIKEGTSIYVGYEKFHDYESSLSIDDFWEYRTTRLAKENLFIVNHIIKEENKGDQTISFTLSDTGSTKGIMTQLRLHHGVLYTLQTLIDTISGPSKFVRTFFESFTPLDTLVGRDIFEDKGKLFIDHALGKDSLNQINCLKSIRKIEFEEKDIPGIIEVYNTYVFDVETETQDRNNLLMTLGNLEDDAAYNFLQAVYEENNFKSDLQFAVLKSLAYTETQSTYNLINELLINNTPFTENNNKLDFFNNLYDSLELAKGYFPKMLELSQYAEYKRHIVELLATGYLDGVFQFNSFSSEKNALFRNAYIELKRTVANQEEGKNKNYYNSNSYAIPYHNLFLDYYTLMCGFKKNGNGQTDNFFKDIYRITDKKFLIEAEIIHHQLGMTVDTSKINEVVEDIDFRAWTYNRLNNKGMLEYFPKNISQEEMAYTLLYNYGFDKETDSAFFIKKVEVNDGKSVGFVYFFKRKTEDTRNWMIDYIGLQPLDNTKFVTMNLSFKKGLSVRNEQEIDKTIDKTIEIFEMTYRKRVQLTTYDWGDWGGIF